MANSGLATRPTTKPNSFIEWDVVNLIHQNPATADIHLPANDPVTFLWADE